MIKTFFIGLLLMLLAFPLVSQTVADTIHLHEDLDLVRVSDNKYVHISYLDLTDVKDIPCNGMVYVQGSEAFLFDTPHSDSLSKILAQYLLNNLKLDIKGVVVNHFHNDCLGGLAYLHSLGIPSYAQALTCKLAQRDNAVCPANSFENELTLSLNGSPIVCRYFGKAHTQDNIVAWLPTEKVLFGGCMVKAIGWGKGNIADADTHAWPKTIKKIKKAYPDVQLIIPGHGSPADASLLDYTIKVFR